MCWGGAKAIARIFEKELPPTFRGYNLLCTTWTFGVRVFPDRLTAGQVVAMLDDYQRFSAAMQQVKTFDEARPIAEWRTAILGRCRGLGGALMRHLLTEFTVEDCAYRTDLLKVIHGDFHYGNFLFVNGVVDAYLDLEEFRAGYPADDLLRYFVCAAEHLRWYAQYRKRRMLKMFEIAVRHMPYSRHEWMVAINARLVSKIQQRTRRDKAIGFGQALNILWRIDFYRRMRTIVGKVFGPS